MEKICKVKGCSNKSGYIYKKKNRKTHNYKLNGFCLKHNAQFKKFGYILERTPYDKNEYIKHNKYYELVLYSGQSSQKIKGVALIDRVDYPIIKNYKWGTSNQYITSRINKKLIRLHHLILGKPPIGYEVDHINHNTYDNRRRNLRFVSRSQNNMNQQTRKDNQSKLRGICFCDNRWRVGISFNKKHIYLGRFLSKQDAINARQQAEIKYFGEYRYQF